jgi:hypothetical protein
MVAKVVGIKKVEFTNDNGEHILGTTVHYNGIDLEVEGVVAESVFVKLPFTVPEGLALGMDIHVDFNRKGKFKGMTAVNPATQAVKLNLNKG